jgi:hypothetical protein
MVWEINYRRLSIMLKKMITLVLMMAVFAGSVFALDANNPLDAVQSDLTIVSSNVFETGDNLFGDIEGFALTAEEAADIEGDGCLIIIMDDVIIIIIW